MSRREAEPSVLTTPLQQWASHPTTAKSIAVFATAVHHLVAVISRASPPLNNEANEDIFRDINITGTPVGYGFPDQRPNMLGPANRAIKI